MAESVLYTPLTTANLGCHYDPAYPWKPSPLDGFIEMAITVMMVPPVIRILTVVADLDLLVLTVVTDPVEASGDGVFGKGKIVVSQTFE